MKLLTSIVVALTAMCCWACSSSAPTPAAEDEKAKTPAVESPATQTSDEQTSTSEAEKVRWRDLHIAEGCTLRVAENPGAFDPRVDWKPCDTGPRGCLEISPNLGRDMFDGSRYIDGVRVDDRVLLIERFSLPGPILQTAVTPLDGSPFLVVEQPPEADCSVGVADVSDDGVLIVVTYDGKDGYASRAYLRAPLREDASWSKVVARFLRQEFPKFTGHGAVSVNGRVVVAGSGGPLRWYDPQAEKWQLIEGSKGCWFNRITGLGDAVSFTCGAIPERLMIARLGEPADVLRKPPQGGGASGVAIDGRQAVWLEGHGRDNNNYYDRIELLTGVITPKLDVAKARVIAELPTDGMTQPEFGGGVVVVPIHNRGERAVLMVMRIADGVKRVLAPPEGLWTQRVLWVTADEIAVRAGPGYNQIGRTVFRRTPIASLPLASLSIDGGVE